METPTDPVRPVWRGRLHQLALLAFVPAGIALIAVSRTASVRAGAARSFHRIGVWRRPSGRARMLEP